MKFLNKFCEFTRSKHTKIIELSLTRNISVSILKSKQIYCTIFSALIHQLTGTPHVCLACAGARLGTIMFKIVCLKITVKWP